MKRTIGLLISVIVFLGMSPCNHFNGLTFVSSGESTIALTKSGEPYEVSLEYSLDGGVWQPYTIGETISLSDGENVMFRAGEVGNDRFSSTTGDYYYFKISGKLNAKGSVMSLLSRDCSADSVPEYAFAFLFWSCDGLMSAPMLPANTLSNQCYYSMFSGCKSLIDAPLLPATELADGCYRYMFYNCTSLTKAPVLPARKLVEDCYYGMFCKCAKLNYVKAMFTDYLSAGTTRDWLTGVSYKGTFVKSYDAHWNMKECGIPKSWDLERN